VRERLIDHLHLAAMANLGLQTGGAMLLRMPKQMCMLRDAIKRACKTISVAFLTTPYTSNTSVTAHSRLHVSGALEKNCVMFNSDLKMVTAKASSYDDDAAWKWEEWWLGCVDSLVLSECQ
jgi:hypothetical protein